MNKCRIFRAGLIAIAILVVVLGVLVVTGNAPEMLSLDKNSALPDIAAAVAKLLAWLVVVAIFVERAVEVITLVVRDYNLDLLEHKRDLALEAFAVAEKQASLSPADADARAKADQNYQTAADAKEEIMKYRNTTKQLAMFISFGMGILLSFAGVHGLDYILASDSKPSSLFKVLDMLITGAIIAGGSEGIHHMANAFTSAMDGISARGDQMQRNAAQSAKLHS